MLPEDLGRKFVFLRVLGWKIVVSRRFLEFWGGELATIVVIVVGIVSTFLFLDLFPKPLQDTKTLSLLPFPTAISGL